MKVKRILENWNWHVGANRLCAAALLACFVWSASPAAAAELTLSADHPRRDPTVVAVEKVLPSVVNIATETIVEYRDWYQDLLRKFYNMPPQQTRREYAPSSIGSGVIIHEDGYVLSNLHVVRRAERTWVKLWDGRVREAERIVAIPRSDVALLKIKAEPGEKFQAIRFAFDDDLLLGETVIAVGNPYGLGGSVSRGILSSKSRRPIVEGEPLGIQDWLQTDAAINPGNSGGPLVNLRGELIGLNVAMRPEAQNIGFAIPVKYVSEALSGFFTPEVNGMLWFGARIRHEPYPMQITQIQPDSPAEKAGLKVGDEILQVNGRKPRGTIELSQLLNAPAPHEVTLVVKRGAAPRTLKTRLIPFTDMIQQKLGITLQELDSDLAAQYGLRERQGMFINSVERGSPAAAADLKRGFILTAVEGQTADNLFNTAEPLTGRKKGDRVRLGVLVPQGSRNFVAWRQFTVEVAVR